MLQEVAITELRGVGPRLAGRLARLHIFSVQDLLFHLPLRYEDRTRVVPITSLSAGDHVAIQGVIESTQVQYGKRPSLLCRFRDASGSLNIRFFHFNANQRQALSQPDQQYRCFGAVRQGYRGLEMSHPEYQRVDAEEVVAVAQHLTPIYPTTEGVQQATLRNLMAQALRLLQEQTELPEYLPEAILLEMHLPPLREALLLLHQPSPEISMQLLTSGQHPAQTRLALEELLAHHLSLARMKQKQHSQSAVSLSIKSDILLQFQQSLPFQLTSAQQRVVAEILTDLSQAYPMQRLVQGDVGSGKTVVAAIALLAAVCHNYQAVMMAPTELLAEQHFISLKKWFDPLGIEIQLLIGNTKSKQRSALLEKIAAKNPIIVVGTHALFQKGVEFANLALVVIDEQHRFGVHQRLSMQNKAKSLVPHQLVMSATPIPRTYAMTLYADLDCSVIDELPPGRQPVTTSLVSNKRRDEVLQRVNAVCIEGRQAYWVCTLIEESEVLRCQAAEQAWSLLQEQLPDLTIGLLHGRQPAEQKEQVMKDFKAGNINLLVATTVIEVGVDVPNASLMIIENPERLGLAQLHQLRGRVGRGQSASHCILLYQHPLSQQAKQRLLVLREYNDGFAISREDLALRGPGEVLGTRQSGVLQMRIADLVRDKNLLPIVQKAANCIINEQKDCIEALIQRWLGAVEQFVNV